MSRESETIQIVLCLVVLFGLGGLCGYPMSARVSFDPDRPSWTRSEQRAQRWIDRRMAQDFARFEATPEQQAALRSSYEQLLSDFNAIQAEASGNRANPNPPQLVRWGSQTVDEMMIGYLEYFVPLGGSMAMK